MYLDQQLHTYLDDLASEQSTPGGGSTAALSGAMGSALACMVSRLTLDKASYAAVHPEIESLLQQAERLRTRFQQLIQEDIEAYGRLAASFKLPRGSSEEKVLRTQAIQEGLVAAARVPLEMAERAAELTHCCLRIAQIGNTNVLSDIATAAALATSAGAGASFMVYTNVRAMKDQQRVNVLSERLDDALKIISTEGQQVLSTVGERA